MDPRFKIDWRNRRNLNCNNFTPHYGTMHYSIASYCTETKSENMINKSELNDLFASETYLDKLKLLQNPLQKNLADTLPKIATNKSNLNASSTVPDLGKNIPSKMADNREIPTLDNNTTLTSIGNFISGIFNVITAVMPFQRRAKSPNEFIYNEKDLNYENAHEISPPLDFWLPANIQTLNKNNCNQSDIVVSENNIIIEDHKEMSVDCHLAASSCEEKLSKVRTLLTSKTIEPRKTSPKPKRPKKVFVDRSSISENFEIEVADDDFVSLPNEDCIQYQSPQCNMDNEFSCIDSPLIKTEMAPLERMDIATPIEVSNDTINVDSAKDETSECVDQATDLGVDTVDASLKAQIIQSCEDKVTKLKALLLERKKSNSKFKDTSSIESSPDMTKIEEKSDSKTHKSIAMPKISCKKFKNPSRSMDKRPKCSMNQNIQEDMTFANEINLDNDHSSIENSPINKPAPELSSSSDSDRKLCFDELKGRFHKSSTTDSEDSFQIVFSDEHRSRKVSECDSEDSFIIFKDTPDSCYTSTDVFGEETITETEESDYESDSGHDTCRLAHTFSRTVSDLTDENLFNDNGLCGQQKVFSDSEDEVDSAGKIFDELHIDADRTSYVESEMSHGVLLNAAKKLAKKDLPPKRVRFSEAPPKVHIMRVWTFAARQARAGHWEQHAVDRERFKRRIADVDMAISWVLKPQHRNRVKFQRFMPWWHAQRRLELAEKKKKQEEERIENERLEKERIEREIIEKERLEQERIEQERIEKERQEAAALAEANGDKAEVGDAEVKNVAMTNLGDANAKKLNNAKVKKFAMSRSGYARMKKLALAEEHAKLKKMAMSEVGENVKVNGVTDPKRVM